jgi:uncharacterized protein YcfL
MKKAIFAVLAALILAACCRCEAEPIVEQNQKLIVPPNFGQMPK